MRKGTKKHLRYVVLALVTVLVASVAASAVALAEGDETLAGGGGPPTTTAKGHITVQKIISPAGSADYDDFKVSLYDKDWHKVSGPKVFSGSGYASFDVSKDGKYYVKEVEIEDEFTPDNEIQEVVFADGECSQGVTKSVRITNTYVPPPPEPCTLKVKKTLVSAPGSTDYNDFTAKVEYPDGSSQTDDFSNSGSHAAYFTVTQAGTYTVTEVSIPAGFTPSPASQTVVFSAEDIAKGDVTIEASITNSYEEPIQTGEESWNGRNGAEYNCAYGGNLHWILHWGGSGNVTEGTLHIVFVGGASAEFAGYRNGGDNGAMHFDSVGTAKVQSAMVTYSYKGEVKNAGLTISHSTCNPAPPVTGCITVHKDVVGSWPTNDPVGPDDFSVTIRNGAGQVVGGGSFDANGDFKLCGLSLGRYTVTEDDPGAEWQITYDPSGGVVDLGGTSLACTPTTQPPQSPTAHVNITNTLSLGSLLVHKTVTGKQYSESPDSPASFSVTVKNAQDQVVGQGSFDANGDFSLTDLVPGMYTVVEDDPGAAWTVTIDPTGGAVTVSGGSQATVNITNERKLGSLLITKTITGDNPDGLAFGAFSVVITGPAPSGEVQFNGSFDGNGEILVKDLLPGTYTVTEAALGYPWKIEGNGPVDVIADQQALKSIVNTGSTSTTVGVVTTDTPTTKSNVTSTSLSRLTSSTLSTGTTQSGGTTSTTVLGFRTSVS